MNNHSNNQAALDDTFIRILIEELSTDTVSLSEADKTQDRKLVDTSQETQMAMPRPQAADQMQAPPPQQKTKTQPPAPIDASAKWQLRIVQQGKKECILPLSEKPISIGRNSKNSLALLCSSISREHARIWMDKNVLHLEDLNSTNGTWVNGTKVPAAYLREKDIICIGKVCIYVEQV
ncbi:MAG: FHA domain-containing protein [Planctomycetota bacterium]|jgi:pSer/pThr/pTyr-binding forkhead associated (FHA) protein